MGKTKLEQLREQLRELRAARGNVNHHRGNVDYRQVEEDITLLLRKYDRTERDALRRLVAAAEAEGKAQSIVLVRPQPPQPARERKPDDTITEQEAAARLGCSLKTLRGHIESGALRYVNVGHGKQRERKRITPADFDAFVANQTKKDSPACLSDVTRAHRSGNTTSKSVVIAFSDRPNARISAKPKR